MSTYFFPLPRTYVVAQIDVNASLRGLGELDSKARAVARSLGSSSTLMMLHTVCRFSI